MMKIIFTGVLFSISLIEKHMVRNYGQWNTWQNKSVLLFVECQDSRYQASLLLLNQIYVLEILN